METRTRVNIIMLGCKICHGDYYEAEFRRCKKGCLTGEAVGLVFGDPLRQIDQGQVTSVGYLAKS